MKPGDKIVVVKGPQRGRVGQVIEENGTCAGETAVHVILRGKRCDSVTFFPKSYLVQTV